MSSNLQRVRHLRSEKVILSARKNTKTLKKACTLMYKLSEPPPQLELSFEEYRLPFGGKLDGSNRWVRLSSLIPWAEFEERYASQFSEKMGANALPFRIALASLLIKERLRVPDREAVEHMCENPYLQYFLGFKIFQTEAPFDPSLFVHFRKRISREMISEINERIVLSTQEKKSADTDERSKRDTETDDSGDNNSGKLLIDSTCTPADIRFPTDISTLNEAREKTENMIDILWSHSPLKTFGKKKPRTYRKNARRDFVRVIKQKTLSLSALRKAVRKQLNYIGRNLGHIAQLQESVSLSLLSRYEYKCLLVISEVYRQQYEMYSERKRSIANRIVSISQPHVRPIVRGKAGRKVEFGAKISASVHDGYAFFDALSWDAYNEGGDLISQTEKYRKRFGHYPESIHADKIYRTRANRSWCKKHKIRLSGPALGRPKKVTETNYTELEKERQTARQDELDRIPIEGKFGQLKRRFSLNRIMAKLWNTSESVIAIAILAMNLDKAMRDILFVLFSFVFRKLEARLPDFNMIHRKLLNYNYSRCFAMV